MPIASMRRRLHLEKARSQRRGERTRDWKLLAMVLLGLSAPAIAAVIVIIASSRPDLFYAKFPAKTSDGIASIIDWETLDRLADMMERSKTYRAPHIFDSQVQLAGYMLPFGTDRDGDRVNTFLLVPDPGNLLHPPHLKDRGAVVVVRLEPGKSVRLTGKQQVWVRGRMSVQTFTEANVEAVFQMVATESSRSGESR